MDTIVEPIERARERNFNDNNTHFMCAHTTHQHKHTNTITIFSAGNDTQIAHLEWLCSQNCCSLQGEKKRTWGKVVCGVCVCMWVVVVVMKGMLWAMGCYAVVGGW